MSNFLPRALLGLGVAALALGAIAFAVADSPSDEKVSLQADVDAETTPTTSPLEETDQPTSTPTAPAATDAPNLSPTEAAEQANEDALETATALNPAGYCVALPNSSDVIHNPDKHTKWTITDCEPSAADTPDSDNPDAGEENDGQGEPIEEVPATNPAGKCKELPITSDVIRHPEKHPGWELGECGEPEE